MKISVIIPVYNGEKYIAQCLENILCQTYKELEIIVVNDGSTDKTAEIASTYPVKLINQENSGVSVARNAGIDFATGDYIHFMDADDLICLDFYEKMLFASLTTGADMSCCVYFHERFPYRSYCFDYNMVVSIIEDKMQMTNVSTYGFCWRYLFKTDFLRKNGLRFESDLRSLGDMFFSLQAVYYANKIVFCPQAIYYYKNREQSIRTSKTKEYRSIRKECAIKVHHLCIEFAQKHGFKILLPSPQTVQFKLFGLPLLKKVTILEGNKDRWYLFGVYFWQRKKR